MIWSHLVYNFLLFGGHEAVACMALGLVEAPQVTGLTATSKITYTPGGNLEKLSDVRGSLVNFWVPHSHFPDDLPTRLTDRLTDSHVVVCIAGI